MRLVRSSVVAIRGSDYVLAAQALGAPTGRILVRHILPNALAPVLIYATIAVGTFISAEAALTYLGIGLQAPEISWGSADQRRAVTDRHLTAPVVLPGTVPVHHGAGVHPARRHLRDALDPKAAVSGMDEPPSLLAIRGLSIEFCVDKTWISRGARSRPDPADRARFWPWSASRGSGKSTLAMAIPRSAGPPTPASTAASGWPARSWRTPTSRR